MVRMHLRPATRLLKRGPLKIVGMSQKTTNWEIDIRDVFILELRMADRHPEADVSPQMQSKNNACSSLGFYLPTFCLHCFQNSLSSETLADNFASQPIFESDRPSRPHLIHPLAISSTRHSHQLRSLRLTSLFICLHDSHYQDG